MDIFIDLESPLQDADDLYFNWSVAEINLIACHHQMTQINLFFLNFNLFFITLLSFFLVLWLSEGVCLQKSL